jgi:hypothetical protein
MHSPPHTAPSQHSHVCDIKAIGSSYHSKPIQSNRASRAYSSIIRGKALGNALNIGDFDLDNVAP